ncbi:MAG: iron ABC transporter permease [Sphaerochaetaceae bacterium]|nr:iron ABC transporter permease [Sphaerochaetaceae bacterium]
MDKSSRALKYTGIVLYTLLFTIPLLITLSCTNLQSLKESVTNTYYLHILSFSFKQALLSALLSLLVGLPGAYIMAYRDFHFKRPLKALFSLPFILPPILVVLGFVVFYGNSGYLNKILMAVFGLEKAPLKILYSFKTVLLAHTFYNFPIVITLVSNSIKKIDHSCEEAAAAEGASSFQIFSRIILPRIIPAAASAAVIVFLYCFTSFSIILVLGGGPELTTLEVEIYRQAKTSSNIEMAAALSILSTVTVLIVLLLNSAIENRSSVFETDYTTVRTSKLKFSERIYLTASTLFVLLPLLSIFVKSGTQQAWQTALGTLESAFNSVKVALLSSFISTALALSTAYLLTSVKGKTRAALSAYCTLPMVTSSVIAGLSYYVIARRYFFVPNAVLLILSHAVLAMPFCLRTIRSMWKDIPVELIESARSTGASERQIFYKIQLPILRPAVRSSLLFAFAISMGELNSTMILTSTKFRTIPIQIYRMVGSYNYEGACALGTVLCVICFAAFALMSKDDQN